MYRVLLPIDRNVGRATAQADAVLDLPGDPDGIAVTLLHVVAEREQPSVDHVERMASARNAAEALESAGIDIRREVRSGDAAEEILDAATDAEADVIVAGRGEDRLPDALFGGVAEAVLDRADRPVLVVRDEE